MKGFGLTTLLCGLYLLLMMGIFSSDSFQENGFLFTDDSSGKADFANHSSGKSLPIRGETAGQGGESAGSQGEISQEQGLPQLQQKDLIRDLVAAPGGQSAFLSLVGLGNSTVYVEVFDISGTRILNRESILQKGENRFVFNLQYVPDGIYLFKAKSPGREGIQKLVKQTPI